MVWTTRPIAPAPDELSCEDCALHMQPLAKINHVLPAGLCNGLTCGFELVNRGEWRFVSEIIFPGRHHAQAERAPKVRDGRRRDQMNFRIVQDGIQRTRDRTPGNVSTNAAIFSGSESWTE